MTKVQLMKIVIAKDEFIRSGCTLGRFHGDDHRLYQSLGGECVNGRRRKAAVFEIFCAFVTVLAIVDAP